MKQSTNIGVLLLVLAACGSTRSDTRNTADDAKAGDTPDVLKPWTDRFQRLTHLVADEIRVEGPDGLLAHLATRTDANAHKKIERVTTQGFLMEITLEPEAAPLEIRAYLDRFELVAMKKLVVLERPGPVDVVVLALGDVFLKDGESEAAQRAPTLRIEGKIPR